MTEELKIIIAAETAKLRQEVDKATTKIKEFVAKNKEKFSEFNDEFQKVGTAAKNGLKVMAGAIAGAATAILALGASTAEYRNEQAKLITAFESAGGSATEAKNTYNDLFRVLGDSGQATEAAAHLAKLTTNQKDLSQWTTIAQGVYATFGSSLPIESLTEAANETAKTGALTGSLADALNWAGISEDAFTESLAACATEQEREKLIRETLNGLYGDAAAKYEENNAAVLAQNEANQKMSDSLAKVGEAVAPINTALTTLGAEVLAQLEPYITEFADKYLPQITEALSGVGDAVGKVITWIADNWDLVSTLAIIIGAISAALAVFSTVMGIVNAVMIASPVTWVVLGIVAAIAAVIAIIILVIKYWDEIKAVTLKVWEAIKSAIQTAINKIKEVVSTAFNVIKDRIINPIKSAFNSVKQTFSNIFNTIKEKLNLAKDFVKSIIDKIKGFFNFEVSLPDIKLPHFSITPTGWKIGDLLKGVKPKLDIQWYAQGGVFDKPTLFNYGGLGGLGENGAEAVVPLEKNTKWLDRLATMLSEKQGSSAPIVLQVDGKTFAQISVDSINALTRQRGSLPLKLV